VTEAGDAEAAHGMIKTGPAFDLITIDMHISGKDGLSFAQELQSKGTKTRLALVTANNIESVRMRAEGLGIRFVAKPLSEAILAQLVES
jgi:CheY-like chemotaxis protein